MTCLCDDGGAGGWGGREGPWKNKRDGMRTAYACAGDKAADRVVAACLPAWAMEEQHSSSQVGWMLRDRWGTLEVLTVQGFHKIN